MTKEQYARDAFKFLHEKIGIQYKKMCTEMELSDYSILAKFMRGATKSFSASNWAKVTPYLERQKILLEHFGFDFSKYPER